MRPARPCRPRVVGDEVRQILGRISREADTTCGAQLCERSARVLPGKMWAVRRTLNVAAMIVIVLVGAIVGFASWVAVQRWTHGESACGPRSACGNDRNLGYWPFVGLTIGATASAVGVRARRHVRRR
jgi:hypothetical protein